MSTETRRSIRTAMCGLLLVALGAGRVEAAPLLVHFQGRVTSPAGVPLTSVQTIRISLIQGGTAAEPATSGVVVYQEDAVIDPDALGAFTHVLGSGSAVATHVLEESDVAAGGTPIYIELSLAGAPVLPRIRITSAGYAIDASRLGGRSADDLSGGMNGNPLANKVVRFGADLEWVSVSQIRVRPGVLGFSDGTVRENATERIWSFDNGTGELGLDTGTEQATQVYYLYAVPDSGDDALFSIVASTGPPEQVGGAGPGGYPVHRFVGSFFNNASADVENFYRSGTDVYWRGRAVTLLNYCASALPAVDTWLVVDVSAYQAETSRMVLLNGYYDAWGGAAVYIYLVPEGGAAIIRFCDDLQSGVSSCDVTLPTVNRQFLYYAHLASGWSNDGSQCLQLHLRGYREDLNEF